MEKDGGSKKFKGKFDNNQGKKPWLNPHKQQVEDRTFESSKGGGGNYRKDKEDKKLKVCNAITMKIGVTCPKIIGIRKIMDRQEAKTKERTLHAKIQMILKVVWWSWLQLQITMSNLKCGFLTQAWLADFDKSKNSNVKLDDNRSLQAEGMGNIAFQLSNGAKAMIKDVLYVPGMKFKLLSVGQLVERGFLVVMKDGVCKLFDTRTIWS
ncbi:uncharacterized protein LOC131604222 [Vicia villosa]|uniref:uncharacterized protein LOC131604222 n=1 Tax=Vicia villosa TaxID=3911 RepID=UPI00273BF015|nr:uncharacterized protein LOC131604222 [Vicia villosa]